jgi:hypothetical protein
VLAMEAPSRGGWDTWAQPGRLDSWVRTVLEHATPGRRAQVLHAAGKSYIPQDKNDQDPWPRSALLGHSCLGASEARHGPQRSHLPQARWLYP